MTTVETRNGLPEAARITFTAALLLFVATIVIGILNGIDVWTPDHDSLIGHVHAGTLGWITLGVTGVAFLMFSHGRVVTSAETARMRTLAWSMVGAVTIYVGAFFLGDALFDDRIQRPLAGTLLFVVVIWVFTWLLAANKRYDSKSPARLGFVLAWVSLMIGAVFGVILGLFISNGDVPGLSDVTAGRVAEAHPPAMLIGYLLLAAFATIEWLLHGDKAWSRAASIQMWLLFVSGIVINIAFVSGKDEELAGPANLLMIIAAIMLLWRSRTELSPDGWKGTGPGAFPRVATLALVGALALLTVLISWIISGTIDFDALTDSQQGLLLSFDHTMFVGVMTNVLFGVLAAHVVTARTTTANRILLWGVNIGFVGFVVGLITTTQVLKRVFTPIMGLALLYGIAVYLMESSTSRISAR